MDFSRRIALLHRGNRENWDRSARCAESLLAFHIPRSFLGATVIQPSVKGSVNNLVLSALLDVFKINTYLRTPKRTAPKRR